MEEITNIETAEASPLNHENNILYGTFAPRLGSSFLDGLIMAPITVLGMIDMIYWKNSMVVLFGYLLVIIYKPFCEYKWNATPGKMAFSCKVVNYNFEKADWKAILWRNVFYIAKNLIFLIFILVALSQSDYQDVDTLKGYNEYLYNFAMYKPYYLLDIGIMIVEIVLLVSDKQSRSLHDRIGKTLVIRS